MSYHEEEWYSCPRLPTPTCGEKAKKAWDAFQEATEAFTVNANLHIAGHQYKDIEVQDAAASLPRQRYSEYMQLRGTPN